MSGQWLWIQSQDVWMFRDAKPFSAQQNFVARSQFPPTPQTIQGVIRTHYLESKGVNWKDYANGDERPELYEMVGHNGFDQEPATLGKLKITGPFIAAYNGSKVELMVNAPLDLLAKAESGEFSTLKPSNNVDFETQRPFPDWKPLHQASGYKAAEGWLSQEQFSTYLNNRPISKALRSSVFEYEDRMGLGMNHKRRSNTEGMLYRARFVRPHTDIGLLLHLNQPLFEDSGFIRIGGESRSARFQVLSEFKMPVSQPKERFKLVLLTPAYFSEGYQPRDGDWSPWVGPAKLVSAVLGKPLAISGWDIARNRPKPLRHFVPAGTVYYFEGGQFLGHPFTESPAENADFGAMGFGSVAVGLY